jgi:hypothetical protein
MLPLESPWKGRQRPWSSWLIPAYPVHSNEQGDAHCTLPQCQGNYKNATFRTSSKEKFQSVISLGLIWPKKSADKPRQHGVFTAGVHESPDTWLNMSTRAQICVECINRPRSGPISLESARFHREAYDVNRDVCGLSRISIGVYLGSRGFR